MLVSFTFASLLSAGRRDGGGTHVDPTYYNPAIGRCFPTAKAAATFYHVVACGLFGQRASREYCEKHSIDVLGQRDQGEPFSCRDAVIDDDSAGGLLIPADAGHLVFDLAMQYGKFEANALYEPMASVEKDVLVFDDGAAIYLLDELEEMPKESVKFRRVKLTAKRLGAYTGWSAEFEQDVQAWRGERMAELFARALAKKKDHCGFLGDGTKPYGGIIGVLNHADTTLVSMPATKTAFTNVTYDDITNLILAVPPETREEIDRCRFWMHPDIIQHVEGLTYPGVERRILSEERTNGRRIMRGYPVEEVGIYPDDTASGAGQIMMSFGSLYHSAVLGNRMQLRVKISREVKWLQDAVVLGVMARFDAKVYAGRHFAHLKTADE
jgi:HK97 family phage major capsid protein